MPDAIRNALGDSAETLRAFMADDRAMEAMRRFADMATDAVSRSSVLLACGNGGSLCDAMHFAEEWTGRFRRDRRAIPAVALSDASQITCIGNDFGFDEIFARQVDAIGRPGDLLVALSTSGKSVNVLRACEAARARQMPTVGLLGMGGGAVGGAVDVPIIVPHARTSDRIQEMHIKILHVVIECVERRLFPESYLNQG